MQVDRDKIISGFDDDFAGAYVALVSDADVRAEVDAHLSAHPEFEKFMCPYGGKDADEWTSFYRHKRTGAKVDVGVCFTGIGDAGFSGVKVSAPWTVYDVDHLDGTEPRAAMSLSERLILGTVMRAILH